MSQKAKPQTSILKKELSTKQFIFANLIILLLSLIFLGGLYYILNIQYQKPNRPYSQGGGPVTTAPKSLRLELEQPDDDTLSFQSSIIISGKTAPAKEVLITKDSQDLVITSQKNGSFSTIIHLDEGVNTITVVVFDVTGEARSSEKTVYYSKEKI